MAVIETKFDVDDVVWHACTITSSRQHPCPDCLGERQWKAHSPAGTDYVVACPRCTDVYMSNRTLNLKYLWHEPRVKRLTIGLVRANADGWDGGAPKHEYMCRETGIGSGSIYREASLFHTEEEAMTVALMAAQVANMDATGWAAQQYADTARFCDYQINDAAVTAAETSARELRYAVEYLIEDLNDAQTVTEVRDRIAAWQERGHEAAPHGNSGTNK
jgi:hypothetical protein